MEVNSLIINEITFQIELLSKFNSQNGVIMTSDPSKVSLNQKPKNRLKVMVDLNMIEHLWSIIQDSVIIKPKPKDRYNRQTEITSN